MHRPRAWAAAAPDIGVFAAFLALYVRTLAPTVVGLDSAELAAGAHTLGIVHPAGAPVYLLVAKAVMMALPVGDVAYRANLLSALCAAGTVALARRAMGRLGASAPAALGAAAMLGVSPLLWSSAVAAEIYSLQALLVAGAVLALLRLRETGAPRDLAVGALLVGLAVGAHMTTVLVLPGLGALVVHAWRARPLGARAGGGALLPALVGPLSYAYLPLRQAARPTVDYATTLGIDLATVSGMAWMLGGRMFAEFVGDYGGGELAGELLHVAAVLARAVLGVGVAAAAVGAVALAKRAPLQAAGLLLAGLLPALFVAAYRVPDKDEMLLVPVLVLALLAASGLEVVRHAAARAGPTAGRAVDLGAAAFLLVLLAATWPLADRSAEWSARERGERILARVGPHALVAGTWIDITPLLYLQAVEGRRPDVELLDWGLATLGRRAELRGQGVDRVAARRRALEEMQVRVAAELLTGRPVYSLDDGPLLGSPFALWRRGDVFLVCERGQPETACYDPAAIVGG